MPIHDWTRVSAGTFHNFHQGWTIAIRDALNRGVLPPGYYAMADQRISGPEPDIVSFQVSNRPESNGANGGVAVAEAQPHIRHIVHAETDSAIYARKANRISIRHERGRVVAILEIVSPGNKDSHHALRSFTQKALEFLANDIHLLVVDLFPPTPRDPHGIHAAIWEDINDEAQPFYADKPLTAVSYQAGVRGLTAYFEPLAVGDALPDMPLFLAPGYYVPVPFESTYAASWDALPPVLKQLVM